MRTVIPFLAGVGAAVLVIHSYMRGWPRLVRKGCKTIGSSR